MLASRFTAYRPPGSGEWRIDLVHVRAGVHLPVRQCMAPRSIISAWFSPQHLWPIGLLVAFALGAVLRLIWVEDMEWKADEVWTFSQTQEVGHTKPFPWLGMPS